MLCIKGNQINYKDKQNPASVFVWGLLSDTQAGWLPGWRWESVHTEAFKQDEL